MHVACVCVCMCLPEYQAGLLEMGLTPHWHSLSEWTFQQKYSPLHSYQNHSSCTKKAEALLLVQLYFPSLLFWTFWENYKIFAVQNTIIQIWSMFLCQGLRCPNATTLFRTMKVKRPMWTFNWQGPLVVVWKWLLSVRGKGGRRRLVLQHVS